MNLQPIVARSTTIAREEIRDAHLFCRSPTRNPRRCQEEADGKITAAIDEAYHIGDTLIFLREYPPDNVAMGGRLQSENPKIKEILKKISS